MSSFTTRLRYGLARALVKAGGLSIVPQWVQHSFIDPSFRSLVKEGYKKNAAFLACVSALSFAFPEPPLLVFEDESDDAKVLPKHPLRQLLRRPNPIMGERELTMITIDYLSVGGNAYWHKVRNRLGQPIELWPYHAGQILPVPGGDQWILRYDYDNGSGQLKPIPAEDIVHFKWPLIDPEQPWMALAPLIAAAREVDTDNEVTRYLYALLKNDATPRTALVVPKERFLEDDEVKRMRAEFRDRYGGSNRGDVAILEGGTQIQRISLDLQELAFDALHKLPETRIAAAMRVPPIIAGLSAGLDRSTYSNYGEARKAFTQDTLAPLWAIVGDEVSTDLGAEFGGNVHARHDLSKVAALQEDVNNKWKRYNDGLINGGLSLQEYRSGLGFSPDPDPAHVFILPMNRVPLLGRELIKPTILDVTPAPADDDVPPSSNNDEPKRQALAIETKATSTQAATRIGRTLQRTRKQVAKQMESAVNAFFKELADRVVERAEKAWTANAEYKHDLSDGHMETECEICLWGERKDNLPSIDELIRAEDEEDFGALVKRYYAEIISASWETWNLALESEIAFDLDDPAVVEALKVAGGQIRKITETTREEVRKLLAYGGAQGWSVDQFVRGDDEQPGLRSLIEETYKGRARTIARTELGTAQQIAATKRYEAAGLDKVLVLDNGQTDPDDVCSQLNGSVQTLSWAKVNLLAHPNCTRCFSPYFDEE